MRSTDKIVGTRAERHACLCIFRPFAFDRFSRITVTTQYKEYWNAQYKHNGRGDEKIVLILKQ